MQIEIHLPPSEKANSLIIKAWAVLGGKIASPNTRARGGNLQNRPVPPNTYFSMTYNMGIFWTYPQVRVRPRDGVARGMNVRHDHPCRLRSTQGYINAYNTST